MEKLHSDELKETNLRYVVRDVIKSVLMVKEYFTDLCKKASLDSALHDPCNIYDGIMERSLRTFSYTKNPFSLVYVSTDVPRQVICERAGRGGDNSIYFSLEGFIPLITDAGGRYKCRLPFVLSAAPASFNQDSCKFLGIQISLYFHPSCYHAVTVEYDLGYFEVDLNSENRVNYRGSRFREILRSLLLNFRLFIPPYSYYRSKFHSKGRFILGEEVEGSVEDCVRVILGEMESKG